MVELHFLDVGCGNMTLIKFPDETTYLYDCNVTDDNENAVFSYLRRAMIDRGRIDVFICSHRDADHMRGVRKVHRQYRIGAIWDAGVPGTTTDTRKYDEYMDLRREVGGEEIKPRTYTDVGNAIVRWMNSKDEGLSGANDQSVVMKVEYKGSSALLAADTTFRPWRDRILPSYSADKPSAKILLGAHHGSASFFSDPSGDEYTAHIRRIRPEMTLISVGPNNHGLPDREAIRLYEKHSSGSNKGNKVFRTDKKRNMKLVLQDNGTWVLSTHQ